MLEKFADGNSAAAFTPNRKVPFLLIMQCSCEGPGSALLVSFIFLQMGMRQGTGLGVQAQATCVFEMVLLTVPFLLHLPSSSFPLALFSLSLCSLSFFLSSSPHLPLWTKISGKLADSSIHRCKKFWLFFLFSRSSECEWAPA